jgi:hypothetical protein
MTFDRRKLPAAKAFYPYLLSYFATRINGVIKDGLFSWSEYIPKRHRWFTSSQRKRLFRFSGFLLK